MDERSLAVPLSIGALAIFVVFFRSLVGALVSVERRAGFAVLIPPVRSIGRRAQAIQALVAILIFQGGHLVMLLAAQKPFDSEATLLYGR